MAPMCIIYVLTIIVEMYPCDYSIHISCLQYNILHITSTVCILGSIEFQISSFTLTPGFRNTEVPPKCMPTDC